jgi:hypothetical protein
MRFVASQSIIEQWFFKLLQHLVLTALILWTKSFET